MPTPTSTESSSTNSSRSATPTQSTEAVHKSSQAAAQKASQIAAQLKLRESEELVTYYPPSAFGAETDNEELVSYYPPSDFGAKTKGSVAASSAEELVSYYPPSAFGAETDEEELVGYYPPSSFSRDNTPSDSRRTSPVARRDLLPRSPSFTFFDTTFRITGRRASHINVVDTANFMPNTIICDNQELSDLLCSLIPHADEHTMRLLACIQTLRLEALISQLIDLEQRAFSVQQEIDEREEMEEFELLSLFCRLDNEQGDDTEEECESSEYSVSCSESSEDESESSECSSSHSESSEEECESSECSSSYSQSFEEEYDEELNEELDEESEDDYSCSFRR